MKDDSRARRAKACIDDARTSITEAQTLLSELASEVTDDNLEAARFSLNVSIKHIHVWEAS